MIEVRQTTAFATWLGSQRDAMTQRRIQVRIDRLAAGNAGQHRVLTGGLCELKLDFGAGYRVYYTWRGSALVILLCGGDKSSQSQDIEAAHALIAGL